MQPQAHLVKYWYTLDPFFTSIAFLIGEKEIQNGKQQNQGKGIQKVSIVLVRFMF